MLNKRTNFFFKISLKVCSLSLESTITIGLVWPFFPGANPISMPIKTDHV
jgi:hypothetical protein